MKHIKNSVIQILSILIILIIPFSICKVTASATVEQDTLTFIQITDTHIIFNLSDYHPNIEQKRKTYGSGIKPLEDFILSIRNSIHPDFMVITGDLTDFFEAETPRREMLDIQVNQFPGLLVPSLFPVYLTLGNHDISSYYVDKNSFVSNQNNAGRARATWIKNTQCFKDGTYYSRIYDVDATIYRLIFLDNSYKQKVGKLPFIIDKPQIHWLEDQMQKSDTDIEIIFMHMPLPENVVTSNGNVNPDQGESDFNEFVSILQKNPSTRLILTGHRHTNSFKEFQFSNNHKLTQVQTAGFGDDIKNWRMIKLTRNNILISNTGNTEIQLVIPSK